MKKLLRSLLCTLLVLSMTVLSTLQAIAAEGQEYISEIKMAICDSLDDAKKELSGYTVLESDLNKDQGNGAQAVYLGYKTTTNKDEAITDLRLMDMNGGYSYNDYDKALKQMAEQITDEINGFFDAIKEFQQNKKAGEYNANYAYQKMNKFKDDDRNGMLLGDVLSDENITAEKLQTIFLQGNSSYILTLEEFLAVGCADNWIERLEKNAKTVYGADAYVLEPYCEIIRKQWEFFRLGLSVYEEQLEDENGLNLFEATGDDVNAWIEAKPSESEKYYVLNFGFAYHILESYNYKGGTLLDYFMVPLEDVDYEYLYPIADAMTKGQLQTLQYVHLNQAVSYAEMDVKKFFNLAELFRDDIEETALAAINDKIADAEQKLELPNTETVSIYDGVDRSLFIEGDGIALTDDAIRKASSSEDRGVVAQVLNNVKWYLIAEAAVCVATIAIAGLFYASAKAALVNAEGAFITTSQALYGGDAGAGAVANAAAEGVQLMQISGTVSVPEGSTTVMSAVEQQVAIDNASGTMLSSTVTIGIAIGVTLVIMGVTIYKGYVKYMNPDYKTVPRAIVDQKTTDIFDSYNNKVGTKNFYYAYYPVQDANPDGEHGDYADMNGWKAQQWNVMYYTKDKRIGQPILANTFVVQYGNSKRPSGYTSFAEFGLSAAADINKHAFKAVPGIFLFYKTAEPQTASTGLGSMFVNGYYALVALAGIAVGVGATIGIGAVVIKKKRKKVTAEA